MSRLPVAQGGDVDPNGDIVGELLGLARGRLKPPLRIGLIQRAIAVESTVDLDEQLLIVVETVARAQARP